MKINKDSYVVEDNIRENLEGERQAYQKTVKDLLSIKLLSANERPLPPEKIREFEEKCRNVTGYKLDDFPPGSCKRGVRRESYCRVLGPFTIEAKMVFETSNAYGIVKIEDGRYQANSTKEEASSCLGKGELHSYPQGSWSLVVKKGLGVPDERGYTVHKDHEDDFGNHAEIAAGDMCRQMIDYIYDHMFT